VTVIVLIGAPGAGKGTQAPTLAQHLGVPHIASGDLFRAAVRDGSPVGIQARRYMERGQLVPDDITIAMLLERLAAPDAADGAILDGFPRNRAQAEALDAALAERGTSVRRAISIEVPAEELLRRLSGRWVCRDSGHVYNEHSNPPRVPGRCDIDGSPLVQRDDDRPETIRARLEQTLSNLREVADHYRQQGILRTIDGLQPMEDVTAAILAALDESDRAPTGAS
jgi:adenylate kinase